MVKGEIPESVRRIFAGAYQVWDYSQENIAFLQNLGIHAKHLPLGYHPDLELIPTSHEQDVDVLFFGSISERREALLRRVTETTKLNVKALAGVYGRERDTWIARSKVVLNVHQFGPGAPLEATRVSYLLNNRRFVLSETPAANPYPGIDLKFGEYEQLIELCQHYVKHGEEVVEIAEASYQRFRNGFPMIEILRRVI